MHGDPERLGERRDGMVDARRRREAMARRHLHVLGEPTGDGHPHDPDHRTALIVARQAVTARAAGRDAFERHRVAGLQLRHAGADVGHLARDLVPGARDRQHHLSVVPVQVGAADAAVAHAHDDLAGAGGRAGNVLDHELAGRTAGNRAHHRRGPRSDTWTSVAFSRARRTTNSRTSQPIGGRPGRRRG